MAKTSGLLDQAMSKTSLSCAMSCVLIWRVSGKEGGRERDGLG